LLKEKLQLCLQWSRFCCCCYWASPFSRSCMKSRNFSKVHNAYGGASSAHSWTKARDVYCTTIAVDSDNIATTTQQQRTCQIPNVISLLFFPPSFLWLCQTLSQNLNQDLDQDLGVCTSSIHIG
jgi:hypothetical protein